MLLKNNASELFRVCEKGNSDRALDGEEDSTDWLTILY